jgi:glucose/arabinose dehydrogenase
MKGKITAVLSALVLGLLAGPAFADVSVKMEKVAGGLTHPIAMRLPADGTKRRFVVEQRGVVQILKADGTLAAEPFLDLRSKLIHLKPRFDERGLLSIEFHPKFKENGKFYAYYDVSVPDNIDALDVFLWYSHIATLSEFTVSKSDPNKADMASERVLYTAAWPQFNHNGGDMHFGPDGMLYVSQGDGGYADDYGIGHDKVTGNGQDVNTTFGKILRIDVNSTQGKMQYAIPKDNPFVGKKDHREEIWAYGFRNPWRFSIDMGGKHEVFVGDVGQNSYEEVDIATKGGNFGWRVKEGTHCFDYTKPNNHPKSCKTAGLIDPILEYNNCDNVKPCKGISMTGGYVYRGKHKAWDGKYIFGDWSTDFGNPDGHVFIATAAGKKWTMEDVKVTNMEFKRFVLAFAQDDEGEVYVLTSATTGPSDNKDEIYRIAP